MTDERGSATIELALLAPVLLILLLFVAFVGRLTEARAEVDAAARDAARAASLMRTGDSAETAARQAAANTLTGDGVGCRGFSVAVTSVSG
jgi:Flp pilus assembly protein TadG